MTNQEYENIENFLTEITQKTVFSRLFYSGDLEKKTSKNFNEWLIDSLRSYYVEIVDVNVIDLLNYFKQEIVELHASLYEKKEAENER